MPWRPTAHTDYPWADSPSTSTALDTANLNSMENGIVNWAETNLELLGIAATPTQTSAYAANAGDFVPVDTSTAAVTVTLPASVADQARVGVKQVNGSNGVTVNATGGAAFDRVGGATTLALSGTQSVMMQYNAAANLWHVMATTSTIQVDTSAADFQMNGVASAGSTGKIADAGHVHPSDTSRAVQLNVRSVKTAAYGPAAGDFVPYDISGGSVTDVLPNAPADGTIVAIKLAKVQASPIGSATSAGTLNSLTINTQGSDTIDDGVQTSQVFYAKGHARRYQYSASVKVWYATDANAGTTSPWCCVGPITHITQQPGTNPTPIAYNIDGEGVVRIRGYFSTTNAISGSTTLFTLPSGLTPSQDSYENVACLSSFADVPIRIAASGGTVNILAGDTLGSGNSWSFDGRFSFPTT